MKTTLIMLVCVNRWMFGFNFVTLSKIVILFELVFFCCCFLLFFVVVVVVVLPCVFNWCKRILKVVVVQI